MSGYEADTGRHARPRTPSPREHRRPRTPPSPEQRRPAVSREPRNWEHVTEAGSTQMKNVFQKMVDPDSYWSVATAGVGTLIISCLLLLWARPFVVLQKNEDGTVEQGKICFTRLIVTSLVVTTGVVGVSIYLKWRRGQSRISLD